MSGKYKYNPHSNKLDQVRTDAEIIAAIKENIAHDDLSDMPDTTGVDTNHDARYPSKSLKYAATVTYNSNGKIATIVQNGVTYTIGRTSGKVTSVTDGTTTLTLTRDSDSKVTSWAVA